MLKIYNTLTRSKQDFVPIEPGRVRMYVCGMTVYDYCHIGHARVMVVFDVVQRWLRASGFRVTYVRNITDIDDKIIRRAAENGETIGDADRALHRAAWTRTPRRSASQKPDIEPRATEYIPQMLRHDRRADRTGLAYRAATATCTTRCASSPATASCPASRSTTCAPASASRSTRAKRDPLDFVLWKAAKPGEPAWESPVGRRPPGLAHRVLGDERAAPRASTFDIHGGGQDLQFPHHENEIAQSEGAHGHTFANYWMHNGFVRVDDEKMSKSLGNFFTVRDVLARYDPEVVRFFILRAHYRSPLNYSDQHLDDARAGAQRGCTPR